MSNSLKLSHYSVEIYNYWHSTGGTLETDETGKIVACRDLNSCDGWRDEIDGDTDAIFDRVMEEANKAIAAGKVPAELHDEKDDYIVVSSVEYDGNCAYIFANYEAEEDDEDAE